METRISTIFLLFIFLGWIQSENLIPDYLTSDFHNGYAIPKLAVVPVENCTIVKNFKVYPFDDDIVHLNISWSSIQLDEALYLSIQSNGTNCYRNFSERIQNDAFIIKPPISNQEYYPDQALGFHCEYNISISNINSNESCLLQYVLPDFQRFSPENLTFDDSLNENTLPKLALVPAENCTIVKNFKVYPLVDDILHLNISWTSTQLDEAMYLSIQGNDTDCSRNFNEPIQNKAFIIKPPISDQDYYSDQILHFQCEYDITISNINSHESCLLQYIFPECVQTLNDTLCNCKLYSPKYKIDSMEIVNTGVYEVRWSFMDPDELGNKLTKQDFYYGNNNLGMMHANITQQDLEAKTVELWLQNLIPGEKYNLSAIFTNSFKCDTELYYDFTAPTTYNYSWFFTIILFFLIIIVALIYNIIKQFILKYRRPNIILAPSDFGNIHMQSNPQYNAPEILNGDFDEYEIPRNRIVLKQEIGSGAFGKIFSAILLDRNYFVAVKTLCENSSKEAMDDLKAEIEIFKKINKHPNIVGLIGCCTMEPPYLMVMEFVPCGDLKNYLFDLRNKWHMKNKDIFFADNIDLPLTPTSYTSSRLTSTSDTLSSNLGETNSDSYTPHLIKELSAEELQNFALQIAKGMAHLEQIPITHRDLAARNILITEYKVLKISDFGMSRTGPYINRKSKQLPLRWMAMEAITEQKCNNKSDVWSFGVVLWEIGTLGAFPYGKVLDSFLLQHLMLGKRLERPEICTNELYDIMQRCWAANPDERPSFEELVAILDGEKQRVYMDFCQLNPTYMFPPAECINN